MRIYVVVIEGSNKYLGAFTTPGLALQSIEASFSTCGGVKRLSATRFEGTGRNGREVLIIRSDTVLDHVEHL